MFVWFMFLVLKKMIVIISWETPYSNSKLIQFLDLDKTDYNGNL